MPPLRWLITRPGEFFYALATAPAADFRGPAAIVLAAGTCSAVSTYLLLGWIAGFYVAATAGAVPNPGFFPVLFGTFVVTASASAFVLPFVIWAVAGAVFYLLSSLATRAGGLYHTLIAVGWGMLPLAVARFAMIPLFLVYRSVVPVTTAAEFFAFFNRSPASLPGDTVARMLTMGSPFSGYLFWSALVDTAGLLACAWLWVHAMEKTRSLRRRDAILTVFVPVILYLVASLVLGTMRGWA